MRFKTVLSYLEIALGLTALLLSVYSFVGQFRCPEGTADCGGWEMLGAQYGYFVGSALLISGLLLQRSGVSSWLGHLVITYAVCVLYFLG